MFGILVQTLFKKTRVRGTITMTNFVQVGFSNMISVDKIEAVAVPDSAPVRRAIIEHREAGRLIDLTCGRRVKSVIFLSSDKLVLSALAPDTIRRRVEGKEVNNGE